MLPESKNRLDHLRSIAARLDAAGWGATSDIVKAEAAQLDMAASTLYRTLRKEVGWGGQRKPRSDKGKTCVPEASLQHVSAMLKTGVRQNAKVQMPATVACSVSSQNKVVIPVTVSQMNRLLRQRQLDVKSQMRASHHIRLRSLHPNHVHQVDPSLCAIYYLRGRQQIMRADDFYKNKLDKVAKLQFKVWRYVLTDHCSGLVIAWYVEAAGETQANLFDFLMFAWGEHEGFPFYGPPKILLWDKGSANSSHGIKNLCAALGVETVEHEAGKARAKGSVENGNNLVETQFESRLRSDPVDSVAALNAAVWHWVRAYNANRLPEQDTGLTRNGVKLGARLDLWLTITADQLRRLPPRAVCAALMRGASATRVVRGDLTISYRHPQAAQPRTYLLSGCPGINVKDTVTVSPLVYGGDLAVAIKAERYDGAALEFRVEPEALPDAYGFAANSVTIGEYKAVAATEVERKGEALDKLAYGDKSAAEIKADKAKNVAPFAHSGGLDAHRYLADVALPTYMPRRGHAIETGARQLEAVRLEINAALLRLKNILRHDFDPSIRTWLEGRFPDGVPEDRLDVIAREWTARTTGPDAATPAPLRLVGGAA